MGSPLGLIVADIVLCHHKTMWLKNCPKSLKTMYYKRHVYDIFALFEQPEQVLRFVKYINKRQKS